MTRLMPRTLTAGALLLCAGLAGAQPASAPARCGPGAASSADCPRPATRWGRGMTPGWAMMSGSERQEHRDRMRSFQSYGECTAYMAQHHATMSVRAQERGASVPAQPRRDACAGLPGAPK